ncbi:MAG: hypothetical protein D6782_07045 [Alphaproteobacteria bacterium]|nr:MAG: hypothetical protein D6782_07045 [Alphaproteobacteria bacterium]
MGAGSTGDAKNGNKAAWRRFGRAHMSDALHTALSGLLNASTRVARAADRIVRVGAGLQGDFADGIGADAGREQSTGTPRTAAPLPGGPQTPRPNGGSAAGLRYVPSLEEETVQLRLAAQAYKANAVLLRAADEMLEMTVESLKDDAQ